MNTRLFKQLAILPGLVLAAALLFWLLLPVFVSTDFVRAAIEREITELAGQRVSVGATTDISLLPTPSARLEDVVVRPGFQRPDADDGDAVATIGAIELQMTLASLFTGKPSFSSIHLVEPVIQLKTGSNGDALSQLPVRNVVTAVRIARQQRAEQTAATGENDTADDNTPAAIVYPDWLDLTVGTVTFENGAISFAENADDQPLLRAEDLDGRLVWPRIDQPLALNATFTLDGQTITTAYSTDNPIDALSGAIADVALTATSDLANLTFSGNAGFTAGFYAFGDLQFDASSMRDVMRWRGDAVRPALGLGAITFSAALQARGSAIRLDQLNIDVDGNAGSGIVEFRSAVDGPPSLIGTLDFTSLELRDFFDAFVTLPANTRSRQIIDIGFMDQIQTDLRISASQASFGDIALTDVAATAQTTTEIALFDIGDATAFGGRLQGRLRFDRRSETPSVEMSIAGEETALDQAKAALPLPAILPDGVANFSVDLSAPLGDWSSLFAQPDGQFALRMAAGTLPGLDAPTLQSIQEAGGFRPVDLSGSNVEAFNALSWTGEIDDGELRLDGLNVDYGDDRLEFSGIIQLASRSLALTINDIRLVDEQPVSEARFFIGGGIDVPYVYPVQTEPLLDPGDIED